MIYYLLRVAQGKALKISMQFNGGGKQWTYDCDQQMVLLIYKFGYGWWFLGFSKQYVYIWVVPLIGKFFWRSLIRYMFPI